MKASILISNPFLIPYGTQVKLVKGQGAMRSEIICFFAGYKTFEQGTLKSACNLFPTFRALSKDGSMSNRFPERFPTGVLSPYDLNLWELEILELETHYPGWDDKANEMTAGLVSVLTTEMLTYAGKLGITRLDFGEFPDAGPCHAVFDDDRDGSYHYSQVSSLLFDQKNKSVTVCSEDGLCGCLDHGYGDYFDVAQSLPHIYKSFCECARVLIEQSESDS